MSSMSGVGMDDAFGTPLDIGDEVVFCKIVGKGATELGRGVVLGFSASQVKVEVTQAATFHSGGSTYLGNHPEPGKIFRVSQNKIMKMEER